MFIVAFLVEVVGAGYTLALARGRDRWAVVLSALSSVLSYGLLIYVVYDFQLFPAAIIGEVAGTTAALKLAKRKMR
jgi:hypothetical protein